MPDSQINYADLERAYSEASMAAPCPQGHPDAVTVSEDGIFHMHCKVCGLYGMAAEQAARTMGWIE